MSVTSGFYNSVNSDRTYNAVHMGSVFDGIINDGVFSAIGGHLVVSVNTGMTVGVAAGRAWFNHTWTVNDSLLTLTHDNPDAVLNRIDTVILEVDASDPVRANSIKIIKGDNASNPVPPTLTNSGTLHQYPLADVLIPASTQQPFTIIADNITNRVGTVDCPFVTGPITTVTTEELLAQWDAEFGTWFQEMKDQLSQDAAGALQLQINEHNHSEVQNTKVVTGGIVDGILSADAAGRAKMADGFITLAKLAASVKFQKIAALTGDGVATWLTIDPLPTDFENLLLVIAARSTDTSGGINTLAMRFNNDSGANYVTSTIRTLGTSVIFNTDSPAQIGAWLAQAVTHSSGNTTVLSSAFIVIPRYKNAVAWKNAIGFGYTSGTAIAIEIGGVRWANTAAITRLDFSSYSGVSFYPLHADSKIDVYGFN